MSGKYYLVECVIDLVNYNFFWVGFLIIFIVGVDEDDVQVCH